MNVFLLKRIIIKSPFGMVNRQVKVSQKHNQHQVFFTMKDWMGLL